MNNENNTHVSEIDLAAITADADVFGLFFPKKSKIKAMWIKNTAQIAASDTDYIIVQLKNGSTVIGSYDSRAAAQGTIAANTPKAGVIDATADNDLVAAGSYLKANYNEEGTVAMSGGKLIVEWYPL